MVRPREAVDSGFQMRPGEKGISDATLKAALRKTGGVIGLAAQVVGTSPQNVRQRIARSLALQEYLQGLEEDVMDVVEAGLLDLIMRKDPMTLRWYAERKGKRRGYAKGDSGLSDADVEAFVASFGGDLEKLRAARDALAAGLSRQVLFGRPSH